MTSWFRSWHGAPTDTKWLAIARRAGVAPGIVSAVAWALMDEASQADDRGDVSGFDGEAYAAFSGFDEDDVRAVLDAFEAKGIVVDGRLAAWDKRQPKREDDSAERVRRYRERKADGDASKRGVTHCNAPDTDTDTDTEEKEGSFSARAREPLPPLDANGRSGLNAEFDQFMAAYPERVGRKAAAVEWPAARRKADMPTILAGLDRYIRGKPPDRQWMSPATFLADERWTDQYAERPANDRSSPGNRPISGADAAGRSLAKIVARERERRRAASLDPGADGAEPGAAEPGGGGGPVLALVSG